MTQQELNAFLLELLPNAVYSDTKQFLCVSVEPDGLIAAATMLRNDPELQFDYLFCLSGVDGGSNLQVVYHLASTEFDHELVLKTQTANRTAPSVESVSHIWSTAEFHEREVYDLFGIHFSNHPDLRRILLDDDWTGYPLRKDYKDDVNIISLS